MLVRFERRIGGALRCGAWDNAQPLVVGKCMPHCVRGIHQPAFLGGQHERTMVDRRVEQVEWLDQNSRARRGLVRHCNRWPGAQGDQQRK